VLSPALNEVFQCFSSASAGEYQNRTSKWTTTSAFLIFTHEHNKHKHTPFRRG